MKSKFSTVVHSGGNLRGLGPRPRRYLHQVFLIGFFFEGGCVLADRSPPSSRVGFFLSLVATVLITFKGAESPDSVALLCFIDPRVRKIRNEASSCPGIFSRTLRFYYVASSPSSPLPHLLDGHRKLVGSSAIPARSCPGPVRL